MFIKLESINELLKNLGLPVYEQMSETPLKKNDYSDGTEGLFSASSDNDEEWTPKKKNRTEWISVNAIWDVNLEDWKDEEKSLHHYYGLKEWDFVTQVWTEYGRATGFGELKPAPLGACLTKPFARTIQTKVNCIPDLYNASSYNLFKSSSEEDVFLVERINILHENEEPDDILLLHTFQTLGPKGVYRAILIVYNGDSKDTEISYIGFPAHKGDVYVNKHLRNIFYRKTSGIAQRLNQEAIRFNQTHNRGNRFNKRRGIKIIWNATNWNSHLIFPHITNSLKCSEWVHSTLTIANDIDVPAFFSFNLPEILEADNMDLGVAIGEPYEHQAVGFLMKKNQKLPEYYYYSEYYRWIDDESQWKDSADYSAPVFIPSAEYEIKMLTVHPDYFITEFDYAPEDEEEEINEENKEVTRFRAASEIVNIIPYEVKQIAAEEALKEGEACRLISHKVEKKWEPDYCFEMKWKLSEFPNIHVIGLFKSKDSNEDFLHYILSESGRWYKWYNFDNEKKDMKESEIYPLNYEDIPMYPHDEKRANAIDWFCNELTGYIFGGQVVDGSAVGSETVYKLKQLAESQGKKIRTFHGGCYLSMINDWKDIWDMLENDRNSGITYNNYWSK